ncbi:hypothetical protein Hanom_Chr06g00529371 [Helianthus anomalus]
MGPLTCAFIIWYDGGCNGLWRVVEYEGRHTRKRRNETDGRGLFESLDNSHSPKQVTATRSSTKKDREILSIYDGSIGNEKKRKVVKRKEIPSLKKRSSLKQIYNAISYMSRRHEEAVKEMRFGGLLGYVVDGIPEKLAFHVVEQFDAENISMNLGNAQLVVISTLISQLLGIREGGLNFGAVMPSKTNTHR